MTDTEIGMWLRDAGLKGTFPTSGLVGNPAQFNITNDRIRTRWARRFSDIGVTVPVLDCIGPLVRAAGLNPNAELGVLGDAFNALTEEAGCDAGVLVHHAGKDASAGAAGDYALMAAAGPIWELRLVRGLTGPRQFRAHGANVAAADLQLRYEPTTKRLTVAGDHPKADAFAQLLADQVPRDVGQSRLVVALREVGLPVDSNRKARIQADWQEYFDAHTADDSAG